MVTTTVLGLPRIGPKRELKFALESHWAGRLSAAELLEEAAAVRADLRGRTVRAGLSQIPVGDFALYDHVLDMALVLDAVPDRFTGLRDDRLALAFAMARGRPDGQGVAALEMTKWFDTNYHYLVPELQPASRFAYVWRKHVELFQEAMAQGHDARPVLLGPLSFLALSKPTDPAATTSALLDPLLEAYAALLADLASSGVREVQLDEPVLVLDADEGTGPALTRAYGRLRAAAPSLSLWLTPYFGEIAPDLLDRVLDLPVDVLHLDLVRGPDQLERVLARLPADLDLSLGLVDGRNIWITDLDRAVAAAERAAGQIGPERLAIATSCSLLHVPYGLATETALDPDVRSWLAFGEEKMAEVALIGAALEQGQSAVAAELAANREAHRARLESPRVHDPAIRARARAITPEMTRRGAPYPERRVLHQARFDLPPIPTTTIGSFPQTREVRLARAAFRNRTMAPSAYQRFLQAETEKAIRRQEAIGLDVLVHGEFERNDMVEYFGERLSGFAFTAGGWVQSYGSRCVKPPIIYGDVARPSPMTVEAAAFAQSLTTRPVKGMLTGPVTILQWSFVRDDQERQETCRQIALAIRDEVADLEKALIGIIQIDEPALREGLPLTRAARPSYLAWAVECYRLAASGVRDDTQIHTHMCYAEFDDIIDSIVALDADVISIETARSAMKLLGSFVETTYPNEIGPGIWDIHSPRVPGIAEMEGLLLRAVEHIPADRLWANPDCGLKTRGWAETEESLVHLVQAARNVRRRLAA
ncbi:5-methyltetrahydropteroyltriglutamate--homocysteine S-methyltransferase [Geminicoccus roseus]|uniref:5-methyltetrahydropteroyltriglutamate-- homocysteine S-methyltransferase n=1 Tax=Geminicoccus roseus TaxID=404900 RepID=UPI000481C2AB|nr:5-methyltetrahydropteroyltriglutamate--homocysteine S-methyltransferase [Geminicoccus roseus]